MAGGGKLAHSQVLSVFLLFLFLCVCLFRAEPVGIFHGTGMGDGLLE